jgi:hypothetical protein
MSAFAGKAEISHVSRVRGNMLLNKLPKLWLEMTRPSRASRFKATHKLLKRIIHHERYIEDWRGGCIGVGGEQWLCQRQSL